MTAEMPTPDDGTDPKPACRKKPPGGLRSISGQLREVIGRAGTAYRVGKLADVDAKVVGRFLAGDRGLIPPWSTGSPRPSSSGWCRRPTSRFGNAGPLGGAERMTLSQILNEPTS